MFSVTMAMQTPMTFQNFPGGSTRDREPARSPTVAAAASTAGGKLFLASGRFLPALEPATCSKYVFAADRAPLAAVLSGHS